MKKFIGMIVLLLILFCPLVTYADGYTPDEGVLPSPTPNPVVTDDPNAKSGDRTQLFSNDITRQQVKSGNIKTSSSLPLILTVITVGTIGGGYYYFQRKKTVN